MIWFAINLTSPHQVHFGCCGNRWIISSSPHLDPWAFCCIFSLLSSWGRERENIFGGCLAGSQGQHTTNVKRYLAGEPRVKSDLLCVHSLNCWLKHKPHTEAKSGTNSNTRCNSHLMREARPTAHSTRTNNSITPSKMTAGSIPVQRWEKNQWIWKSFWFRL